MIQISTEFLLLLFILLPCLALFVGCVLIFGKFGKKHGRVGIVLIQIPLVLLGLTQFPSEPRLLIRFNETWSLKNNELTNAQTGIWTRESWKNFTNDSELVFTKETPDYTAFVIFHNENPVRLEVGVTNISDEVILRKFIGKTTPVRGATRDLSARAFYDHRKISTNLPACFILDTNSFVADLKSKGITLLSIE